MTRHESHPPSLRTVYFPTAPFLCKRNLSTQSKYGEDQRYHLGLNKMDPAFIKTSGEFVIFSLYYSAGWRLVFNDENPIIYIFYSKLIFCNV